MFTARVSDASSPTRRAHSVVGRTIMFFKLLALVLIALPAPATGKVATNKLVKALGSGQRPVVVHLHDTRPTELESFAAAEVSYACRDAGANAVLVAPSLVKMIVEEQETSRGEFPGPLPVITDMQLADLTDPAAASELCAGAKNLGSLGIGIRYYQSDWPEETALEEALAGAMAAADEHGLGTLLLGEFGADNAEGVEGAGGLASRLGAAAGLAKSSEESSKLAFGCWNGSPDRLAQLRADGFKGLILKDACRGDLARGSRLNSPSLAARSVSGMVKAALSKGSTSVWAGAASGGGGSGTTVEEGFADYYGRSGDPRDR